MCDSRLYWVMMGRSCFQRKYGRRRDEELRWNLEDSQGEGSGRGGGACIGDTTGVGEVSRQEGRSRVSCMQREDCSRRVLCCGEN